MRRFALSILTSLLLLHSAASFAAGTRNVIHRAGDFLKGEMKGVGLDAEGRLSPAPMQSQEWKTDADYVWCLARDAQDRLLVGTGNSGVIYRQEGEALKPWSLSLGLEVLSLLSSGKTVLAGTAPDGTVYRVAADGSASVALESGQQSIWCLAKGKEPHTWLAGTGPEAQLLRLKNGQTQGELIHAFPAANLVAIVEDASGFWVTTHAPALLYRVEGNEVNPPRLVYEAPRGEIRSTVSDGAQGVYLLLLESSKQASNSGQNAADHSRILWLPADGGRVEVYAVDRRLLSLARMPDGTLVAGEAETGRLHHIEPLRARGTMWGDLEGGDPLCILVSDKGGLDIGTGNPGSVFHLKPAAATTGQFTSPVIDTAGAIAWGRIRAETEGGKVEVRTRSGIRKEPDASWSHWSDAQPVGRKVDAPLAPYLQYRLELDAGEPLARVSSARVSWRERNLAPQLQEVRVEPAEATLYAGGANSGPPSPVSQQFDDGLQVEYSMYQARQPAAPETSTWARGLRSIRWKAEDPNSDRLRFAVEVQRLGSKSWYTLGKDLEAPVYAWDTRAFEDGAYRVRVRADDGMDNDPDSALSSEQLSALVTVDNTPPVFTHLKWKTNEGQEIEGEVKDEVSPLTMLSMKCGKGEWTPVRPVDAVLDGPDETFHLHLSPECLADSGRIWLRAVDAAGNVVLRELQRP